MYRDYVQIKFLSEHDDNQSQLRRRLYAAMTTRDSNLRKALAEFGIIPETTHCDISVSRNLNQWAEWAWEAVDRNRALAAANKQEAPSG